MLKFTVYRQKATCSYLLLTESHVFIFTIYTDKKLHVYICSLQTGSHIYIYCLQMGSHLFIFNGFIAAVVFLLLDEYFHSQSCLLSLYSYSECLLVITTVRHTVSRIYYSSMHCRLYSLQFHTFVFPSVPHTVACNHHSSTYCYLYSLWCHTFCYLHSLQLHTAYICLVPRTVLIILWFLQLAQAKRVFSQFARGPAYNKYLAQLEEVCSAFWRAGHQQCEAYSLSGNLCTNQVT